MSSVGTDSGRRAVLNQDSHKIVEEKAFGAHQWRHKINPREAVDIDKIISPVAEEIISRLDKGEIEFKVVVGPSFKSIHYKELRDVFWSKGYSIVMVDGADMSKGLNVLVAEPMLSYKSVTSNLKHLAFVVIENVPTVIIGYAFLKTLGIV